jgi:hypothetical protein
VAAEAETQVEKFAVAPVDSSEDLQAFTGSYVNKQVTLTE